MIRIVGFILTFIIFAGCGSIVPGENLELDDEKSTEDSENKTSDNDQADDEPQPDQAPGSENDACETTIAESYPNTGVAPFKTT